MKIFPDERFYPTNTREFKKLEVEEKMTSNNSLYNRGLLNRNDLFRDTTSRNAYSLFQREHHFNPWGKVQKVQVEKNFQ